MWLIGSLSWDGFFVLLGLSLCFNLDGKVCVCSGRSFLDRTFRCLNGGSAAAGGGGDDEPIFNPFSVITVEPDGSFNRLLLSRLFFLSCRIFEPSLLEERLFNRLIFFSFTSSLVLPSPDLLSINFSSFFFSLSFSLLSLSVFRCSRPFRLVSGNSDTRVFLRTAF